MASATEAALAEGEEGGGGGLMDGPMDGLMDGLLRGVARALLSSLQAMLAIGLVLLLASRSQSVKRRVGPAWTVLRVVVSACYGGGGGGGGGGTASARRLARLREDLLRAMRAVSAQQMPVLMLLGVLALALVQLLLGLSGAGVGVAAAVHSIGGDSAAAGWIALTIHGLFALACVVVVVGLLDQLGVGMAESAGAVDYGEPLFRKAFVWRRKERSDPAFMIQQSWQLPEEVCKELGLIVHYVMRDFIDMWFGFVSDDNDFVNDVHEVIGDAMGRLLTTGQRRINPVAFLSDKVMEAITLHLRCYRDARNVVLEENPELFQEHPGEDADVRSAKLELMSKLITDELRKAGHLHSIFAFDQTSSRVDGGANNHGADDTAAEMGSGANAYGLDASMPLMYDSNAICPALDLEMFCDPERVKRCESKYVRYLSNNLVRKLLQGADLDCKVVRHLVRELLSNSVLLPALALVTPDNLNIWIAMGLQMAKEQQNQQIGPDGRVHDYAAVQDQYQPSLPPPGFTDADHGWKYFAGEMNAESAELLLSSQQVGGFLLWKPVDQVDVFALSFVESLVETETTGDDDADTDEAGDGDAEADGHNRRTDTQQRLVRHAYLRCSPGRFIYATNDSLHATITALHGAFDTLDDLLEAVKPRAWHGMSFSLLDALDAAAGASRQQCDRPQGESQLELQQSQQQQQQQQAPQARDQGKPRSRTHSGVSQAESRSRAVAFQDDSDSASLQHDLVLRRPRVNSARRGSARQKRAFWDAPGMAISGASTGSTVRTTDSAEIVQEYHSTALPIQHSATADKAAQTARQQEASGSDRAPPSSTDDRQPTPSGAAATAVEDIVAQQQRYYLVTELRAAMEEMTDYVTFIRVAQKCNAIETLSAADVTARSPLSAPAAVQNATDGEHASALAAGNTNRTKTCAPPETQPRSMSPGPTAKPPPPSSPPPASAASPQSGRPLSWSATGSRKHSSSGASSSACNARSPSPFRSKLRSSPSDPVALDSNGPASAPGGDASTALNSGGGGESGGSGADTSETWYIPLRGGSGKKLATRVLLDVEDILKCGLRDMGDFVAHDRKASTDSQRAASSDVRSPSATNNDLHANGLDLPPSKSATLGRAVSAPDAVGHASAGNEADRSPNMEGPYETEASTKTDSARSASTAAGGSGKVSGFFARTRDKFRNAMEDRESTESSPKRPKSRSTKPASTSNAGGGHVDDLRTGSRSISVDVAPSVRWTESAASLPISSDQRSSGRPKQRKTAVKPLVGDRKGSVLSDQVSISGLPVSADSEVGHNEEPSSPASGEATRGGVTIIRDYFPSSGDESGHDTSPRQRPQQQPPHPNSFGDGERDSEDTNTDSIPPPPPSAGAEALTPLSTRLAFDAQTADVQDSQQLLDDAKASVELEPSSPDSHKRTRNSSGGASAATSGSLSVQVTYVDFLLHRSHWGALRAHGLDVPKLASLRQERALLPELEFPEPAAVDMEEVMDAEGRALLLHLFLHGTLETYLRVVCSNTATVHRFFDESSLMYDAGAVKGVLGILRVLESWQFVPEFSMPLPEQFLIDHAYDNTTASLARMDDSSGRQTSGQRGGKGLLKFVGKAVFGTHSKERSRPRVRDVLPGGAGGGGSSATRLAQQSATDNHAVSEVHADDGGGGGGGGASQFRKRMVSRNNASTVALSAPSGSSASAYHGERTHSAMPHHYGGSSSHSVSSSASTKLLAKGVAGATSWAVGAVGAVGALMGRSGGGREDGRDKDQDLPPHVRFYRNAWVASMSSMKLEEAIQHWRETAGDRRPALVAHEHNVFTADRIPGLKRSGGGTGSSHSPSSSSSSMSAVVSTPSATPAAGSVPTLAGPGMLDLIHNHAERKRSDVHPLASSPAPTSAGTRSKSKTSPSESTPNSSGAPSEKSVATVQFVDVDADSEQTLGDLSQSVDRKRMQRKMSMGDPGTRKQVREQGYVLMTYLIPRRTPFSEACACGVLPFVSAQDAARIFAFAREEVAQREAARRVRLHQRARARARSRARTRSSSKPRSRSRSQKNTLLNIRAQSTRQMDKLLRGTAGLLKDQSKKEREKAAAAAALLHDESYANRLNSLAMPWSSRYSPETYQSPLDSEVELVRGWVETKVLGGGSGWSTSEKDGGDKDAEKETSISLSRVAGSLSTVYYRVRVHYFIWEPCDMDDSALQTERHKRRTRRHKRTGGGTMDETQQLAGRGYKREDPSGDDSEEDDDEDGDEHEDVDTDDEATDGTQGSEQEDDEVSLSTVYTNGVGSLPRTLSANVSDDEIDYGSGRVQRRMRKQSTLTTSTRRRSESGFLSEDEHDRREHSTDGHLSRSPRDGISAKAILQSLPTPWRSERPPQRTERTRARRRFSASASPSEDDRLAAAAAAAATSADISGRHVRRVHRRPLKRARLVATWEVLRRYNDFDQLAKHLHTQLGRKLNKYLPDLPQKEFHFPNDKAFVQKRTLALNQYLQRLIRHPMCGMSDEIFTFLTPPTRMQAGANAFALFPPSVGAARQRFRSTNHHRGNGTGGGASDDATSGGVHILASGVSSSTAGRGGGGGSSGGGGGGTAGSDGKNSGTTVGGGNVADWSVPVMAGSEDDIALLVPGKAGTMQYLLSRLQSSISQRAVGKLCAAEAAKLATTPPLLRSARGWKRSNGASGGGQRSGTVGDPSSSHGATSLSAPHSASSALPSSSSLSANIRFFPGGPGGASTAGPRTSVGPGLSSVSPQRMYKLELKAYGLIKQVFELDTVGIMRRQAISLLRRTVRVFFTSSMTKWLRDLYTSYASVSMSTGVIKWIRETVWPDGELVRTPPPRSEQQIRQARDEALQLMHNALPGSLESIVGKSQAHRSTKMVFDFLQNPWVVKSLLYSLTDLLLIEMFPEFVDKLDGLAAFKAAAKATPHTTGEMYSDLADLAAGDGDTDGGGHGAGPK